MRRAGGAAAAALACWTMGLGALAAPAALGAKTERIGLSVQGRPIGLTALGPPAAEARRTTLVVGCVHGDECAARAVVARLAGRAGDVPRGARLLLVRNMNPDGFARGTRGNARGVDLNRNAREGWRTLDPPGGRFHAGRGPFSEPETRAIRAVLLRERPDVVIWFHQPLRGVDVPESGPRTLARRYARLSGLPLRPLPAYPGSLSRWTNARVRAGSSFVVELAGGPMTLAQVRRHARAVLALARR